MTLQILYFPASGETDAPKDYLLRLQPVTALSHIEKRLKLLAQRPVAEWGNFGWVKPWEGKIWQLTHDQTRVTFCVDDTYLVVLHACKKVKQKTTERDANRTRLHYAEYLAAKVQK